ncbi:MAG: FAD-dependent oxidoreductase [Waterburya sp.]
MTSLLTISATSLAQEIPSTCLGDRREFNAAREYDVIVFGDEVPGVMTALKVKRELAKSDPSARVALITEGNIERGVGGHLVRGGLAYLDRNQVPQDLQSTLGIFRASSQLYQEFLTLTATRVIAFDRSYGAIALKQALAEEGVEVIGNVNLKSVATANQLVCYLKTENQGNFAAQQFIDATQGGKLAEISGVQVLKGLAHLGFPDSSLSVGWVFEIYGLDIQQLKQIEAKLINRFLDRNDRQAQEWLKIASGNNPEILATFRESMTSSSGQPALMYQATPDSADVRSLALSIAFHGSTGRVFDLRKSKAILDRANIAVFNNRLSLNALLFDVDAAQARQLSNNGAKPTATMIAISEQVRVFFQSLGAERVKFMKELYIRSAGQIAQSLDDLTATKMTEGGVPAAEALGTFSYHLDIRGGIAGLKDKVSPERLKKIHQDSKPTFNYGFRHTLPVERANLSVLGPASGFGGLGKSAGRIVELNVSVGEGLALAVAMAITQKRSLSSISNLEVRHAMSYTPVIYGRKADNWFEVFVVEKVLRQF